MAQDFTSASEAPSLRSRRLPFQVRPRFDARRGRGVPSTRLRARRARLSENPFAGIRFVWMNGRLVEFENATIHIMSHAMHYGSGLFEGIRCYNTPQGSAVFRLQEHLKRLENSCKVYLMDIPFTREELAQ